MTGHLATALGLVQFSKQAEERAHPLVSTVTDTLGENLQYGKLAATTEQGQHC